MDGPGLTELSGFAMPQEGISADVDSGVHFIAGLDSSPAAYAKAGDDAEAVRASV